MVKIILRKLVKSLENLVKNIVYFLWLLLSNIWVLLWYLANINRRFTVLLSSIIGLMLFIIIGTLTPSIQPFEGTLQLNSLTFTSKSDQPFIKNADAITQITQTYAENALPLILTGQFSDSDPKIEALNTITLNPIKNQESWWQIEAIADATLEIKELKLTSETTLEHLEYDSTNKRLSINNIIPQKHPLSLIIDASSSDKFTVTFQGYEIPQFPDITSFTWQPNNQITLTLNQPVKLEVQFQESPNNRLFWGRLAVENVKLFNQPIINPKDYADYYKESAISGGTVRLADKNYTLEVGQFLTFKPEDSISSLLGLKITDESTPTLNTSDNKILQINEPFRGLKLDISGKTKKIEIGLNERLPVATLQASWLERFFPRDAVIALITFLSTLVTLLLGWLWEIVTKNE